MTILLTTHYLDEAERLCDRVAIMHAGRIVALDTPAGAARRPRPASCVELRVARRRRRRARRAARARGIAGDDAFTVGATLTVPLHDRTAARRDRSDPRRSACDVSSISTRRPTLDDVYLQLTGGRLADAA